MHKNSMDTAIKVYLARPIPESDLLYVSCSWWNLGYAGKPWELPDGVTDFPTDPEDWVDITDRRTIKRTAPGLP